MSPCKWPTGFWPVLFFCILAACGEIGEHAGSPPDPLSSWEQGAARDAILEFVRKVTDPEDAGYVAPADRVAVFDNDGTLIVERPMPVQFAFMFDRVMNLMQDHPEWTTTQPFKAVIEDDLEQLRKLKFEDRRKLGAATQASMTQDEFNDVVNEFLSVARHPRFEKNYLDLVYQPMLELIAWLQAKEFKVFIVSGGGIEFIRRFSEPVYGIPRENVIGSSRKSDLHEQDGRLIIYRVPKTNSLNAARYKPLNIQLHTGRRPILAVGNSDGDIEMLRFTDDGPTPALVLLVHHDDPDREYAYEEGSAQALQAAAQRGWQVINMRDDFNKIFPNSRSP